MAATAELILANRSYLDHDSPPGDGEPPPPASGGLLAAVRPAIQPWDGAGTTWIGAGRGCFDTAFADEQGIELIDTQAGPLRHRRLFFDDSTWAGHYADVANGFLWPLLHLVRVPLPEAAICYPRPSMPTDEAWDAFVSVNRAFADAALRQSGSTCWVHDYQLALAPAFLRSGGFSGRTGFFLHTPFPDLTVARRYLDARGERFLAACVSGMLEAGLIGFQSRADVQRFAAAATELRGARPAADGLLYEGRTVFLGAYPVGVDAAEVASAVATGAVPATVESARASAMPFVVGLERCDFTKGIPERLAAVTRAFETGERFAYAGIAAPTREGVPGYAALNLAVAAGGARAEQAATANGGAFLQLRQAIAWPEVIALQREADVIFTSSLADGMNLVPLQAALAQERRPRANRAMVIAGRDTGVAEAFAAFGDNGLTFVDPLEPEQLLATLRRAASGQLARVSDAFIAAVRARDAHAWATSFLTDLEETPC